MHAGRTSREVGPHVFVGCLARRAMLSTWLARCYAVQAVVGNDVGRRLSALRPLARADMGTGTKKTMEDNKQTQPKPKGLSLKVKTLEKKSAPSRACGGAPVIGYS